MARPMVTGSDLISAGLDPAIGTSQLLAYARKLHLAGLTGRQPCGKRCPRPQVTKRIKRRGRADAQPSL